MKTVCIKIGGSIADGAGFPTELARAVSHISRNCFPLVVHGGGKAIARMLDSMNKEFKFVEGMRVTDAETLAMVQMVLSGDVNKTLVNAFISAGIRSIGISGVDCGLFTAEKMLINGNDIGFVGSIKKVDPLIIDVLRKSGITPVISPISRGTDGTVYNVNADVAAGDLAEALKADNLIFVSDVKGVLIHGEVRHRITVDEIEQLITDGHATGGMVPKLRSAAEAVSRGVGCVHICGWHGATTLADELGGNPAGTVICP